MDYTPVDLAYLRTITDCTGIIQHGTHGVPNRKLGYTTDDNVRALIVAAHQYEQTKAREDLDLAITYLSFIHFAQNPERKFANVMTYQREFLDQDGTEDCYGRTMWACGYTASSALPENMRVVARNLFDTSIVWAGDLKSPRAIAYTIIGMCNYLQGNEDLAGLKDTVYALASFLVSLYRTSSAPDWDWYEPYMTYGNAIIPLAMVVAAIVTGNKQFEQIARSTIRFMTDLVIINDRLEIIGNDGWYFRGNKRAWYDQQTIDAGYTVYLYLQAYKHFGDKEYLDLAHISHSWFFGNNRSGISVYDTETKGCYDAVTAIGVNLNQGAESIICFLLAQLMMNESLSGSI